MIEQLSSAEVLQTEIVDSPRRTPSFSPIKTHISPKLKTNFSDARHWDELSARYLSHYDLPSWDMRPDAEAMQTWLERLDLSVTAWIRTGTYRSLQDFIDLNPTWPLRAFIGLALELREEKQR